MRTTLSGVLALAVGVGCGSSSAPVDAGGGDGGGDAAADVKRPRDSGHRDGVGSNEGSASETGASDGNMPEAASDVVTSEGGKGDTGPAPAVQCFEVFGSGSGKTCGYSSSTSSSFSCTGGLEPGTCPSSGLVGCCVVTSSDAGVTEVAAICYYDTTSAAAAMGACTKPDEKWTTSAP